MFSRRCLALRPRVLLPLWRGPIRSVTAPVDAPTAPEELSLKDFLHSSILARGPMSVGEYMRLALAHPSLGYYTNRTVFGTAGDFTTSPEISQMFGELIGVWCVTVWQQLGSPSAVSLIELGPGKGTLMADVLRTARRFPPFYKSLQVRMVEMSPKLINEQRAALGCAAPVSVAAPVGAAQPSQGSDNLTSRLPDGIPISWHWRFSDAVAPGPSESSAPPVIILAHEFFDALPVHQFQYHSARGWCERLVDVANATPQASPSAPAAGILDGGGKVIGTAAPAPAPAEEVGVCASSGLRLVLAPGVTPTHSAAQKLLSALPSPAHGDVAEFSPAASATAFEIGNAVGKRGGAALIMDYGRTTPLGASVRGIKSHAFVDFLHDPGHVDISADVDFSALSFAVKQTGVAVAHGPVNQGPLLFSLGLGERLEALVEALPEGDEESADRLIGEAERLVSPEQMGVIYKALAITPAHAALPVGFQVQVMEDEEGAHRDSGVAPDLNKNRSET